MLEKITEADVVIRFGNDEIEFAVVKRREDGKYEITWTDYIINVWTETFDDFSTALLRAATLMKCGEQGWESFRQSPEEFAKVAEYFFDITVSKS